MSNQSFCSAAPWVNQEPFWFGIGHSICWCKNGQTKDGIVQGFWINFSRVYRDTITLLIRTPDSLIEETFPAYDRTLAWTLASEHHDDDVKRWAHE